VVIHAKLSQFELELNDLGSVVFAARHHSKKACCRNDGSKPLRYAAHSEVTLFSLSLALWLCPLFGWCSFKVKEGHVERAANSLQVEHFKRASRC
jgi:hypothetical protein